MTFVEAGIFGIGAEILFKLLLLAVGVGVLVIMLQGFRLSTRQQQCYFPPPFAMKASGAQTRNAFCTRCGAPFNGDADFCGKCGTPRG